MNVRAAIEASGKALADGINAKDAAAAAACYSEDGSILAPETERVNGRDAIQTFWQNFIDAGLSNVSLTAVEVEEYGNAATEVGIAKGAVPSEGGGQTNFVGKYIVLWRKGPDGNWYMHRDIWNFDA